MSVRIYVGNLPEDTKKEELLETVFRDVTAIQSLKLMTNRKTQKCRGFGFLTVKTEAEADELVSRFNGQTFRDQVLKVEKALPRVKDKDKDKDKKEKESVATVEKSAPKTNAAERPTPRRSRRKGEMAAAADLPEPDPRWADALRQLRERLAQQEIQLK